MVKQEIKKATLSKESINELPSSIGIYIFSKGQKILYVGKATNIKARVRSHVENAKIDKKEALIIENSDSIEFIQTDSDFKALLLESKLIQTHHPKYNVRWKDDKSYLYIKITIKDEYPKVFLTRRPNITNASYFGPFPSVASCEEIIRSVRRIFPFCTQKKLGKIPCFYSKIGLCDPCPNKISNIKDEALKRELKRKYRKNIRNVIKVLNGKIDVVVRDLYKELKEASGKRDYERALTARNKILRLERLITQARIKDIGSEYNIAEKSLKSLNVFLSPYFGDLKNLRRIECYDISNLNQREATASLVVFVDGQADKSQYRKFRIKDLKSRSDFEMLEETIRRRFKNKWDDPDLIIVDGGKPQVRILISTLSKIDKNLKTVGIAKNPDRLIIGTLDLPTIRPASNNPGFNMIKHIRDESHRFARKYHLHLRKKAMFV